MSRPPGRVIAAVAAAALISASAAIAVALPGAAPAGAPIDVSKLRPTFDEPFKTFDRSLSEDDHGHRWRMVYGYGGPDALSNRNLPPNQEQQIYMDPAFRGLGIDPFRLEPGGGLHILGRRTPPQDAAKLWNRPYTSGLITTLYSFSQTYGYFEFTARLAPGAGLWPAFWLLPTDGDWPPELDVMENPGKSASQYFATAHSKGKDFLHHPIETGVDLTRAPHAYGVLWGPREVVWYFDRHEVAREPTPPDMHKPMYLLANLVVGGTWSGSPDASTPFPADLLITHIGAWATADTTTPGVAGPHSP